MPTYTVMGWNARRPPAKGENYHRTPADVDRFLREFLPANNVDAACLLEVASYHDVLASLPGYDALIFTDPGHGDNAILVRHGIEHTDDHDIEHGPTAHWLTVRGGKTWGRAHVVTKLPGLRLVAVHTPPSVNWVKGLPIGPLLRIVTFRAMMTSLRKAIEGWTVTEPDDGLFIFGDWNEPAASLGADSPADVAADNGLSIFRGAPIDWGMGRNVTGGSIVIGAPHNGGSDHPVVLSTVTVAATTPAPAPSPRPVPTPEVPVTIKPLSVPFVAARWHGGAQTPKAIVIHGTVSPCVKGNARSVAHFFATHGTPTSAHYVVDPGETIQCVGDHTVAYHCGYNTGSISFELSDPQAGPGSRWQDANHKAMLDRAAHDVAQTCLAYGIDITHPTVSQLKVKGPHGIYGHNDSRLAFGHTTHSDPGPDFPWPAFIAAVRAAAAEIQKTPAKQEPAMNHMQKAHVALGDAIVAANTAVAQLQATDPSRVKGRAQLAALKAAVATLRSIKARIPAA